MKSLHRFWIGCGLLLVAILVVAAWGYSQWHLKQHTQLVAERLVLLNELRRGALQQYFATAEAELHFWSTSDAILQAQAGLLEVWREPGEGESLAAGLRKLYVEDNPNPQNLLHALTDPGDGSAYTELHRQLHPRAKLFVTERGYYDFFLISPEGDILYTVEKEADFATNLDSGEWRDTALADVFTRVRDAGLAGEVVMSDMRPYGPSAGAPAIFMAQGLAGEGGELLGVIALQLPTDQILQIMNYTSGMAETGETYLVGRDGLMRSNSRFSDESTVLRTSVETEVVALALEGGEGVRKVIDYRGVEVLSAYAPLRLGDFTWAVLAEIDRAEVEQLAAAERPALAGALGFFYGLSLWSIWYWRGRQLPAEEADMSSLALDAGDFGEGGMAG